MHKIIIVSSCLFGSVYIFTKTLQLINQSYLENKQISNKIIILNGVTCMISGSVFLYAVLTNQKLI
jgi:ABC-type enterochelin transport system permease subunit